MALRRCRGKCKDSNVAVKTEGKGKGECSGVIVAVEGKDKGKRSGKRSAT